MKIATIVGARPQFIKAATLSRTIALKKNSEVKEILIHTGQHYDDNMSAVFFNEMELAQPNYFLGIGSGNHGAMTGRMLEAIEEVLSKEKPDWVLVYGDTNSTLAGALAAAKMHIPIAHVEAGLRSFNQKMPEEINRILADHCSTLLFTPTENATLQLHKEGISSHKIIEVGDVMYEAALHYRKKAYAESTILKRNELQTKKYALATIHRAENTDTPKRLEGIVAGLCKIAEKTPLVWPVHPRTRNSLKQQALLNHLSPSIKLIEPVGYLDMLNLETNAEIILTDSGGVQKEAYFFKVPCITLREETEWTELVHHGFNRLTAANAKDICQSYEEALNSPVQWNTSLYGDGNAAQQILQTLLQTN